MNHTTKNNFSNFNKISIKDIPFIHLLRIIAVCMVLYDHFIGVNLNRWVAIPYMPFTIIETYLLAPLGIIQSLGFMGVSLFFLVSGYIITHTASAETQREFFIKRLLRIYPPLILSIVVCVICQQGSTYTLKDILLSFTLLNYLTVPQVVIQGVAWSLVIEVNFYLITLLFLPLMKWSAWIHILVQSSLVALCIQICRAHGNNFFLFAAGFSYLPYLLIGQLIYFLQTKRISLLAFAVLFSMQFGLIEWGVTVIHTQFLPLTNSYMINFMYSIGLFLIASLCKFKTMKGIPKRMAEMSYSIYLLHGSIGGGVLNLLLPRFGFSLAFIAAISSTLAASYLSFNYVEKPSQRIAKKWISMRKSTS